MITAFGTLLDRFDCCPFQASAGRRAAIAPPPPVYTAEQRRRRDGTRWTMVQGVLAPLQFAAFLISTGLVLRYLGSGEGFAAASASVVVKTLFLYAIMVTGAFWEKAVFGRYLFAPVFFWEDLFSFLVIGLHTAYLVVLATGALNHGHAMLLALTAYAAYTVNAAQFVLKLRAVRRDAPRHAGPAMMAAE